jgi:hypothetical protein
VARGSCDGSPCADGSDGPPPRGYARRGNLRQRWPHEARVALTATTSCEVQDARVGDLYDGSGVLR